MNFWNPSPQSRAELSLPMLKSLAHKATSVLQEQGKRAWYAIFTLSQATRYHNQHVACALMGKQKVYRGTAHRADSQQAEKAKRSMASSQT